MSKYKKKNVKLISTIILLVIVMNIIIMIIEPLSSKNYAASRSEYAGLYEDKYPGYNSLIHQLKSMYPNAKFTMLFTGLDWNQVIKSEAVGHGKSPRNLITASKSGEWICSICGTKPYDNGSWNCASEKTISYMMDPRNWLNSMDVFQFEEVKYIEGVHTLDGVKKMTNGTFISGDSCANAIIQACKNANISPYYVAARIKQEQGNNGGTTGKGMVSNGVTYYNIFNVNASGNSSSEIIQNALAKAKAEGWTTKEKSIIGGINFLKTKYINRGQNTLYLNKFDVDDSDNSLYSHQYMQNVQASKSEATTVYGIYDSTGKKNSAFNFIIPLYENMPVQKSAIPGNSAIYPINVKTTGTNINIRSAPNTSSSIVTTIKELGTVLLSVERNASTADWDKVVLQDGRVGYVHSDWIQKVPDVTNCNELATVNDSGVNMRSGPGLSHVVITTLSKGQILTVMNKNTYNVDGFNWYRVILADGRQGFITSQYLSSLESGDTLKVASEDGVVLRSAPGISSSKIITLPNNSIVTRIEKGSQVIDGHFWDKIVTGDGIWGYVSRTYLIEINGNTNHNVKLDSQNKIVLTEKNVTADDIKKQISNSIVKDKYNNEVQGNVKVGTGTKVYINGQENIVAKIGDVSGDGEVDARDSLRILKYAVGQFEIKNEYYTAADVSKDGQVDSRDSLRILKSAVGQFEITV